MDKRLAAAVGAATALMAGTAAQAAPVNEPGAALQALSYSDLLQPIPNALDLLKQHDAQLAAQEVADDAMVEPAQFYYYEHHHHHHNYDRRRFYHHHHHHHNYYRRYYHHHHHHFYGYDY